MEKQRIRSIRRQKAIERLLAVNDLLGLLKNKDHYFAFEMLKIGCLQKLHKVLSEEVFLALEEILS